MPDDAIEREHWSRQSIAGIVIQAIVASRSGKGMALPAGRAADEILTLLAPAFASQQAPEKAVKLAFTFAFARGFKTAEGTSRSCLPAMDEAWEDYAAMLDAAPSVGDKL